MPGDDFSRPSGGGQEKKGPWSAEEDEILTREYDPSGTKKWAEVAMKIPGRSAKQCRERWEQNLKPNITKTSITEEEGFAIMRHVDHLGKKWAQIARQLGNRSDNSVKNWYNGMLQKCKGRRNSPGMSFDHERHFSPQHQQWLDDYFGGRGSRRPQYHPYAQHQRYMSHAPPQHYPAPMQMTHLGHSMHLQRYAALEYEASAAHGAPVFQPMPPPPMDPTSLTLAPIRNEHYAEPQQYQYAPTPFQLPFRSEYVGPQEYSHATQERRSSMTYSQSSLGEAPVLSNSRGVTPGSALSSPQTPLESSSTAHMRHWPQTGASRLASHQEVPAETETETETETESTMTVKHAYPVHASIESDAVSERSAQPAEQESRDQSSPSAKMSLNNILL